MADKYLLAGTDDDWNNIIQGGMGLVKWTYELLESGSGHPIADARILLTTDAAGENRVAQQRTNTFGIATFWLDPGTYYVWRAKAGISFVDPDIEVVEAPTT